MWRHSDRVRARVVDARVMLLDNESRTLLTLNPAGTLVWQALDGGADLDTVTGALQQRYPSIDPARLHDDAARLITELVELGALLDA